MFYDERFHIYSERHHMCPWFYDYLLYVKSRHRGYGECEMMCIYLNYLDANNIKFEITRNTSYIPGLADATRFHDRLQKEMLFARELSPYVYAMRMYQTIHTLIQHGYARCIATVVACYRVQTPPTTHDNKMKWLRDTHSNLPLSFHEAFVEACIWQSRIISEKIAASDISCVDNNSF